MKLENSGKRNTNVGTMGGCALDYKAPSDYTKGGSRMKHGTSTPPPFVERAGTTPVGG
jgi:hypothetical protein